VKPGISAALVCQIDLPSSFAAFTGTALAAEDAPDSSNVLSALLGDSTRGRDLLDEQAGALSLRSGTWKYIEPSRGQRVNANTNTELGNDPGGQIYDLAADPGETRNLISTEGARAKEMQVLLQQIRQEGRSRKP
jgi:arylsulfatase A-like enzyme